MVLLGLSIAFQIMVGIILAYSTKHNIEHTLPSHRKKADRWNHRATMLVMLVTVLNVFISGLLVLQNTASPSGGATSTPTPLPAVTLPSTHNST
ncbi:ninjurin-1-like [Branchiostoma floridae x Branchiostoma belcheri]